RRDDGSAKPRPPAVIGAPPGDVGGKAYPLRSRSRRDALPVRAVSTLPDLQPCDRGGRRRCRTRTPRPGRSTSLWTLPGTEAPGGHQQQVAPCSHHRAAGRSSPAPPRLIPVTRRCASCDLEATPRVVICNGGGSIPLSRGGGNGRTRGLGLGRSRSDL